LANKLNQQQVINSSPHHHHHHHMQMDDADSIEENLDSFNDEDENNNNKQYHHNNNDHHHHEDDDDDENNNNDQDEHLLDDDVDEEMLMDDQDEEEQLNGLDDEDNENAVDNDHLLLLNEEPVRQHQQTPAPTTKRLSKLHTSSTSSLDLTINEVGAGGGLGQQETLEINNQNGSVTASEIRASNNLIKASSEWIQSQSGPSALAQDLVVCGLCQADFSVANFADYVEHKVRKCKAGKLVNGTGKFASAASNGNKSGGQKSVLLFKKVNGHEEPGQVSSSGDESANETSSPSESNSILFFSSKRTLSDKTDFFNKHPTLCILIEVCRA
jgi:hypothetical protein